MAYMNQERKAIIASAMKPVLKKYGVKGTLSVQNHSSISLNLKSGSIDFIENYIKVDQEKPYAKHLSADQISYIREKKSLDVNPYWYQEHFSGKVKKFLDEAFAALKSAGYYDKSDAQIDYFDTAYYFGINVGKWNQPYEVVK